MMCLKVDYLASGSVQNRSSYGPFFLALGDARHFDTLVWMSNIYSDGGDLHVVLNHDPVEDVFEMENQGKVLMNRYEFGRRLGQGNFAKVYYGRKIGTGQSVAIKVIDKEKVLKVGLVDQTKREISGMKLVEHPNILKLFEVMANKNKIFYVMEYAKGGELFNKIAKGKLEEESAKKYFQQLMFAVDFCHTRGVYHRDLKPENLLLDENGDLKVSDFGLSALADSKRQDGLLHTTCGTPAYVSPEIICRKGYDGAKSDVWSCGVILFVLFAGYLPFHDINLMEMYKKIAKAEYKCPNWIPREVRKLLSRMLDPNPNTRISSAKVLENPWFQRGLESKSLKSNGNIVGAALPIDTDSVLGLCGNNYDVIASDQDLTKTNSMNAFDLISLSTGFDLSGLFEDEDKKKDIKFTSVQHVSIIISKLEDLAKQLRMKIMKKDGGLLKMERAKEGWKGLLSIDAEIFEFTPTFHLVEMKISSGDTLEYLNLLKQDIRTTLKDVVWAWPGEQ